MSEWQDIKTAPKNARDILVMVKADNRLHGRKFLVVHWAQDLSGEEQPPFKGWFREAVSGFVEVDAETIMAWHPIPPPESST